MAPSTGSTRITGAEDDGNDFERDSHDVPQSGPGRLLVLDDLRTSLSLSATARLAAAEMKRKAARELTAVDGRTLQSDALVRAALQDVRAAAQMLQIQAFLEDRSPSDQAA
jgi:hypothetical protein